MPENSTSERVADRSAPSCSLSWEFIEELIDSAWGNEEILREVEIRFGLERKHALIAIQTICNCYADGAPDALPSHREAANLEAWARRQFVAPAAEKLYRDVFKPEYDRAISEANAESIRPESKP